MPFINQERRSLFLLFSVVLFFVLAPFLEDNAIGEFCLVLSIYLTLVSATMELSGNRVLFWSAVPLAGISMVLVWANHLFRTQTLLVADHVVLAAFFGLVSVSLFNYLGRPGEITSGRLYVSVSLYFLLGLGWFALYTSINAIQPGSFAEAGIVLAGRIPPSKILYFSLATLTTVGYGDIVAVRPAARMLATMEAAAGVLYIAITVARLVASYQITKRG
jgi:hypothetical protein